VSPADNWCPHLCVNKVLQIHYNYRRHKIKTDRTIKKEIYLTTIVTVRLQFTYEIQIINKNLPSSVRRINANYLQGYDISHIAEGLFHIDSFHSVAEVNHNYVRDLTIQRSGNNIVLLN
jgi:hypothetical protein